MRVTPLNVRIAAYPKRCTDSINLRIHAASCTCMLSQSLRLHALPILSGNVLKLREMGILQEDFQASAALYGDENKYEQSVAMARTVSSKYLKVRTSHRFSTSGPHDRDGFCMHMASKLMHSMY